MTYQELLKQKRIYLDYLEMKKEQEDWHGVADCAMDLRELEVMIRMSQPPAMNVVDFPVEQRQQQVDHLTELRTKPQ